jgi:hypothetical protein
MKLGPLAATLIVAASANAQTVPDPPCSAASYNSLSDEYFRCIENEAKPFVETDKTAAEVADAAFAACAASRTALMQKHVSCSRAGLSINYDDQDRHFRNRIAEIIAQYRNEHPRGRQP